MTRTCAGGPPAWITRAASTLTIALSFSAAGPLAHAEPLAINDKEYFEKRGLNVLVFTNEYNGMFFDEKTAGIEIVHHGVRDGHRRGRPPESHARAVGPDSEGRDQEGRSEVGHHRGDAALRGVRLRLRRGRHAGRRRLQGRGHPRRARAGRPRGSRGAQPRVRAVAVLGADVSGGRTARHLPALPGRPDDPRDGPGRPRAARHDPVRVGRARAPRRSEPGPERLVRRPYAAEDQDHRQGWATTNYHLHKAFPDLVGEDLVTRGLDYLFGTHPAHNYSFVSAVGNRSKHVAYGSNRADFAFIAGGVVPGVLVLKPDYPENMDDWPFLWGENEYVIDIGASYIFLAHAAGELLGR